MSNFNLVAQRTQAIQNIPRLTFQLPQSTTSIGTQQSSPILFCQSGCQLEFTFNNISGASVYNDGTFFSITPSGGTNYIKWNGSNTNGQELVQFDLKEVYFQAPAKDVVGAITYNKSIQFYLVFVNEQYNNQMIVISVIGQANNTGNVPQTNGFVLLNSLANQIPLRGDDVQLANLSNFNLGTLLPSNKSFFSTLVNSNTQYISMTQIIDIPLTFFNNMISRVIGSTQAYQQKVNNYVQNTPVNPAGTIIFYNENIEPIGAGQAFVCDSNCQQVVGKSSALNPTIGTKTTRQVEPRDRDDKFIKETSVQAEAEEQCEEEEMWPGDFTDAKFDKKQKGLGAGNGFVIATVLIVAVVLAFIMFYIMHILTGISGSIFSANFWQTLFSPSNLLNSSLGIAAVVSIIICSIVFVTIFAKQANDEDKKQKPSIALFVGFAIYGIIAIYFLIRLYYDKKYSPITSGIKPLGSSPFSGDSPDFQFESIDPKKPYFKLMNSARQISENPQILKSNKGQQLYKQASNAFAKLPAAQKLAMRQQFGPELFKQGSQLSQAVRNGTLNSSIIGAISRPLGRYISQSTISPAVKQDIMNMARIHPTDLRLQQLSRNLQTSNRLNPQQWNQLINIGVNPPA